jgi:antitoxin (DNA-binding transcriptional repressor) of toxin-antitoxin stability system
MVMKLTTQSETITIPAGEFKAKCLRLMDDAVARQQRFSITKRGKVVGDFVPAKPEVKPFRSLFGRSPDIRVPSEAEWREFKAELADEWDRSTENFIRGLGKPQDKSKKK